MPVPSTARLERSRLIKTIAYYAAFVVLGLAAAALGPTLQGLAKHVGSSMGQISYLFVLRSLGYLAGSLLAGHLYDRVKGHPLMALVILILAATAAAIPLIPALWMLAAALFVLGLASSMLDVGGNTLLVWVHRERMGPYMNGLHFFWGLGAFLSPVIIAQTVQRTGDIYWAFWSLALLMLPSAFWLSRLGSPPPIVSAGASARQPARPVLIGMIAAFFFLYVGAELSFGGWVFTYATSAGLGSTVTAAYLTSGFWGAMTAGRMLSIPIAARFSPRVVLLVDLLIVLFGLGIILIFPASLTGLWIGTLGVGLGMASIFPTLLAIGQRHMTITGSITGWFFVGSSLGGMSLPWVVGQLIGPFGPRVVMIAITVNIALALILYFSVTTYTNRISQD